MFVNQKTRPSCPLGQRILFLCWWSYLFTKINFGSLSFCVIGSSKVWNLIRESKHFCNYVTWKWHESRIVFFDSCIVVSSWTSDLVFYRSKFCLKLKEVCIRFKIWIVLCYCKEWFEWSCKRCIRSILLSWRWCTKERSSRIRNIFQSPLFMRSISLYGINKIFYKVKSHFHLYIHIRCRIINSILEWNKLVVSSNNKNYKDYYDS